MSAEPMCLDARERARAVYALRAVELEREAEVADHLEMPNLAHALRMVAQRNRSQSTALADTHAEMDE